MFVMAFQKALLTFDEIVLVLETCPSTINGHEHDCAR